MCIEGVRHPPDLLERELDALCMLHLRQLCVEGYRTLSTPELDGAVIPVVDSVCDNPRVELGQEISHATASGGGDGPLHPLLADVASVANRVGEDL